MEFDISKILTGEINLEDLSLEEFTRGRPVYSSYHKAQCPGFEAEHIHSVAHQIKDYNELHGTNYKTSDRKSFKEETGCLDDTCYRVTPLEHIICHYLKAKEDPEEAEIFYNMCARNMKKIQSKERVTLENCVDFAELRVLGREKAASKRRGIPWKHKGKSMKEITGNPNFVSPKKGKTIQEITGNPNYVSPIKGKTMKEITGNQDYVSPIKGKTRKEITGNPDYVDWKLGKTKSEIVGDPNYVNPRLGKKNIDYNSNYVNKVKGKTMKEITGNPDYVDWKLGKTMKEITGNPSYVYPFKGKTMKERTGNPDWNSPFKGTHNLEAKERNQRRYSLYKEGKEKGTFKGTWNEFQHKCKLEGN